MNAKGIFIAIEGMDGSGKGTLAKKLFQHYKTLTKKTILTAEPSPSPAGKKIRALLKKKQANLQKKAETFLKLFLEDRKHHVKKTILPALRKGAIVICDRYKHSTIAFQSLQGIPTQKIIALHKKLPTPNLTLILDLPPKTALKRIHKRAKHRELFEKLEFMQNLRKKYLSLSKLLPKENIKTINASAPQQQVFARAAREIEKTIKTAKKG